MKRRSTGVLVLLLSGGVTYALSQTLILPAMPALVRSLDADPLAVSWLLTAFLVAASVATPLLGRMGDLFGRGRVLTATMAVFTFGSALCAVADSLGVLIFGRVLQGAAGGVFPLAYGIIRDTFPEAGRMRAIGILSVTLGVGAAFGPVVAGAVVGPRGSAGDLLGPDHRRAAGPESPHGWSTMRPRPRARRSIGAAAFLMAGWLSALLVLVTQGDGLGWLSAPAVGLAVATLVLLAWWLRTEQHRPAPLVDCRSCASGRSP